MTEAPSHERLQTAELRFNRALRDADRASLEQLLTPDFTATELGGESGIARREFLRRVLYAEVAAPPGEPMWTEVEQATPKGAISYSWTDNEGARSTRVSFWINTEEGLRLRQYIAVVHTLSGQKSGT